jgi:hypothetical protein
MKRLIMAKYRTVNLSLFPAIVVAMFLIARTDVHDPIPLLISKWGWIGVVISSLTLCSMCIVYLWSVGIFLIQANRTVERRQKRNRRLKGLHMTTGLLINRPMTLCGAAPALVQINSRQLYTWM